jgi:hypothetical protein
MEAALDTPRTDAPRRAAFAEKDFSERQEVILYALHYGVPCDKVARTQRERDFCKAMREPVDTMRAKGHAVDVGAVPR